MYTTSILIVIVLVIAAIILIAGLAWSVKSSGTSSDSTLQFNDDLRTIQDTMVNDSHLQRLLMIEIINDKPIEESIDPKGQNQQSSPWLATSQTSPNQRQTPSEAVTFAKISNGMAILGKSMVRSFGVSIAQRIATLMHRRNEIIREYYRSMRSVVCQNGSCVHIIQAPNISTDDITTKTDPSKNIIIPLFPGYSQGSSIENLDITIITHRKLETITREITDTIAASFQLRDVEAGSGKKRPLVHYQRLFNLISMYDKELINQAKSYASKHYDISMNCAQSSLEISQHISNEFSMLMKESQQKLPTMQ